MKLSPWKKGGLLYGLVLLAIVLEANARNSNLWSQSQRTSLEKLQFNKKHEVLNRDKGHAIDVDLRGGGKAVAKSESEKKSWFPIYKSELPQFIYLSVMMFLIIYVYTTVRDTKDTLVVSNCGAESIPFLKMYGVTPCALLFIVFYSKMSTVLSKQALFYTTLMPFFIFYTVFAFIMFPNKDMLHAGTFVTSVPGLQNIFNLLKYWSFSLYFIVSELWASTGVPLFFWQIANDITTMSQAKRFYPLFAVTGNLAPIMSGKVMSYLVSSQEKSSDGFSITLKKLAMIKGASGVAIAVLYKLIYHEARKLDVENIATKKISKKIKNEDANKKAIKKKEKPSFAESLALLTNDKNLRSVAMMVIGYNICIELTEVLWKGILRKVHTTEASYMNYMASFSSKVGCIAIILQLSATFIIKKLGWTNASQLTPIAMLALALPFFIAVMASRYNEELIPLSTALAIGTWQNIANKVCKYSLFDPLKEMCYISMDPEAKTKGKAAIDVMGSRIGRSLSAATQQALVLLTGSILQCVPYLAFFYMGTVSLWIAAVKTLGDMFNDQKSEKKAKAQN